MAQIPGKRLEPPLPNTLKRYGLTAQEWLAIAARQKWRCGICGSPPKTGRLVTDHEHIKGWKKLPAEERKKFVRGLLCYICNHRRMTRGTTLALTLRMVDYLERYHERKWAQ